MRTSRVFASLGAAAAASAATLAFAAPAAAYPPAGNGHAQCSASAASPGEAEKCSAGGFDAFERANGYVHSARVFVGSTTANAQGVATLTFTVPRGLPAGTHTFQLVGQTSGHVATQTFVITKGGASAPASNGSGLPFTGGNDVWQLTAAGAGLVLVGGGLVMVRRRRSHAGLAA